MALHDDTIFALSSGGLPAGVAVIRISGNAAFEGIAQLCGALPASHRASLRNVRRLSGEIIDQGLLIIFRGPASFTGEDCVELQVHGGRAVVHAILDTLSDLPEFRQAEAGEFSRRAFENGKLDLVEVEGLADLVKAETEAQRRLARYMAEGHLSRRYEAWMSTLSRCRALIEAELDFSDEGDIPGSVSDRVWREIAVLETEMQSAFEDRTADIIRDGFRVAIAGAPNAGKSSLLNYLAKRDIAIVTDVAGTTRDVLQADIEIDGMRISFLDTAGLRETDDVVENIGIGRARAVIGSADLVLLLSSGDESEVEKEFGGDSGPSNVLRVRTKHDLGAADDVSFDGQISVQTGFGIDSLVKQIAERAKDAIHGGAFDTPMLSRHRNNICDALRSLREALYHTGLELEIRAELLRVSADHLGKITGRVSADELLGMIFSEFCVGK